VSRPSITTPIFETSLDDLETRLQGDNSGVASELRREVHDLKVVFGVWQEGRPTDAARLQTIHRLFDVYRRTMDYLTARK